MSKIIIATAIRDIPTICKKDEVVSIHVHNRATEIPTTVTSIGGEEIKMITRHDVFSIINQDGLAYSDKQLRNIVGYVSLDKLFIKHGE
jgi:hypothetical protein